jgi:hypothetical protein
VFLVHGDEEAADAFDDHDVGVGGHDLDRSVDGLPVEWLLGALGRDCGGQWLGVALRTDQIEWMSGVGAVGEELGVFADQPFAAMDAAGAGGLEDGDAMALLVEDLSNRGGDDGLADSGVGAGDEEGRDGDGREHVRIVGGIQEKEIGGQRSVVLKVRATS